MSRPSRGCAQIHHESTVMEPVWGTGEVPCQASWRRRGGRRKEEEASCGVPESECPLPGDPSCGLRVCCPPGRGGIRHRFSPSPPPPPPVMSSRAFTLLSSFRVYINISASFWPMAFCQWWVAASKGTQVGFQAGCETGTWGQQKVVPPPTPPDSSKGTLYELCQQTAIE